MATTRVKYHKQYFPIESYTFDSANSVATIVANTAYTNLLYANLAIYLASSSQYTDYKTSVGTVSGNTFTASVATAQYIQNLSHFGVDGYLPGQTGGQEEHTLPRGTGCDTVVQSFVSGTGGASYNIDVSLDKSHWIPVGTITHTTASEDTGFITISPGWVYMRANLISVGANTNLVILTGE